MAGLTIYCPFCGQRAGIRTTEKLSLLVTKARIYCPSCGQLNADFVGQISNIKRAVYVDCPEANNWEKTEKETLQENGKGRNLSRYALPLRIDYQKIGYIE